MPRLGHSFSGGCLEASAARRSKYVGPCVILRDVRLLHRVTNVEMSVFRNMAFVTVRPFGDGFSCCLNSTGAKLSGIVFVCKIQV